MMDKNIRVAWLLAVLLVLCGVYVKASKLRFHCYHQEEKTILLIEEGQKFAGFIDLIKQEFSLSDVIVKYQDGEELFSIKSQKGLDAAIETTLGNQKKHVNLFIWSLRNNTSNEDNNLLNKIMKNQNFGSINLDLETGLYLPLWFPTITTVASLGGIVLLIYLSLTLSNNPDDAPSKTTIYLGFLLESLIILISFWLASYLYYVDAASMHFYFPSNSRLSFATVIFGASWGVVGPIVVIVFVHWISRFTEKDFMAPIAQERQLLMRGSSAIYLILITVHEIAVESLSLGLFMLSSYQLSHSIYFAAIGSQLLPSLIRSCLHNGLLINLGLSLWVYLFIAYAYYIPGILLVLSAIVWIGLNFLTSSKPRYDYVIMMILLDSMASVWIAIFVWNISEMIYFTYYYKAPVDDPAERKERDKRKKTDNID